MDGLDMGAFVAPKSNQLNADDLMGGPRTIVITRVAGTGAPDQPVAVSFDGDDGRPYLPCKSMRRVMVAAWGADASRYVGRAMTIYRDPKVAFGGMEVGGIRISHMSHLDKRLDLALTVTKAKRAPYRVEPLKQEPAAPAEPAEDKALAGAEAMIAEIGAAPDMQALLAIVDRTLKQREWLTKNRPELGERVAEALKATQARLVEAEAAS